jgi:hypothetical protein
MQLSPDGLAKLYDLPVEATIPGMRLQAQMMQSGDLANQAAGIRNLYDSQNNPNLVEQTRLENQSKLARLPGEEATSRSLGYKADLEGATHEQRKQAAIKEFALKAKQADLDDLEARAQEMAYSTDPTKRAQGAEILRMHKDMIRDREKQDAQLKRQIALEQERGTQARLTQQQGLDGGRYARSGGAGAAGGDPVLSGKVGFEKAAAAAFARAQQAFQDGDVEEAQRQMGMANQYTAQLIQLRQAGASATQAGKIDTGAVANLPTVPLRAPQQFTAPQGAVPNYAQDIANGAQFSSPAVEAQVRAKAGGPPKQTLSQVQQMYPGVPADKLREAYKKKFGVDLQ